MASLYVPGCFTLGLGGPTLDSGVLFGSFTSGVIVSVGGVMGPFRGMRTLLAE